ncbi:MAG: dihydroorotase, partial [Clostridia bacterium]|nr:dihydroorotase [Clostridia bacterium]
MENQALALALRTFMEAGGFSPILSDSYMVLPGFCDVHVHFREPGYFYKETVHTGCDAAIHGGYTAVYTMPNLNPVPDCKESLQLQLDAIRADGRIAVLPYGAITVGEKGGTLADLEGMAENVVAFSDDGRGVQSREMMKEAMLRAKALGKIIVAHCEDNSLLKGGYIHDGVYAKTHGHRGICSESEYLPIARDLELVRETGCAYHVCHVSAKESVELIRKAKAEGLNVTCETAPHYLVLCDEDLQEDGRFKMNPPIRGKEDRDTLIAGILDGTVDMIATDHAPHSAEEKGEVLADLEGMAQGAIAFSDDGRGVQSDDMMRAAMERAKALNKPIVAHCEVNELLRGGYIHDGE